jgi:hypothetical protein
MAAIDIRNTRERSHDNCDRDPSANSRTDSDAQPDPDPRSDPCPHPDTRSDTKYAAMAAAGRNDE